MKPSVRVEYVDAESGRTLGRAHLPVERVPNPLELKPRLQLDEGEFVVVRAEPERSQDVRSRGELRLTVRRVVDLPQRGLLHRLPTLADALPALAPGPLPEEALRVERDAWRQVELLSRDHAEAIAEDLLAVRRILAREEEGGYAELVLRRTYYPAPLHAIDVSWIEQRFHEPKPYPALTLNGLAVPLRGGFALRLRAGIDLYGVARNGRTTCLALRGWGHGRHLFSDAQALGEVLSVHRLVLVDWCRGRLIPSEELATYFAERE